MLFFTSVMFLPFLLGLGNVPFTMMLGMSPSGWAQMYICRIPVSMSAAPLIGPWSSTLKEVRTMA